MYSKYMMHFDESTIVFIHHCDHIPMLINYLYSYIMMFRNHCDQPSLCLYRVFIHEQNLEYLDSGRVSRKVCPLIFLFLYRENELLKQI